MIILNLLNRIFGSRESLTREEIDSYQKGKGDLHAVEEKSLSNEFDSDALEGWTESGIPVDAMKKLDARFEAKYKNGSWSSGMVTFFTLFFVATGLIMLYTYSSNNIEPVKTVKNNAEQNLPATKNENLIAATEKENRIENKNEIQVLPQKEIKPSTLQRKKEQPKEKPESTVEISKQDNTKAESDKDIKSPLTPEPTKIPVPESKNALKYSYAKEIYLHDFKLVDYRAYRSAPIKTSLIVPVGTPADQETRSQNRTSTEIQETDIPYIDYLEESMAYFEKADYKKALKRFNKILETYPEDVNANFYGALCYYNMGNYSKSVEYFDASYSLLYGNFREEAQWFKSKAYIENGQESKARSLLKSIVEEKGFYAEGAKDLLKMLEK